MGGGKLSVGQTYETAVAKLCNMRSELTLMLQKRSETNAEVKKAETSVSCFKSLAKKNLIVKPLYRVEIKENL